MKTFKVKKKGAFIDEFEKIKNLLIPDIQPEPPRCEPGILGTM